MGSQNENLQKQEYLHLQTRIFFQADKTAKTTIFNNEKKNNIPLPKKKKTYVFFVYLRKLK